MAVNCVAEEVVKRALAERDTRRAADALWRQYGSEVFGWLVAVYGASEASEVAGALGLAVVRGIAGFRGESSARTWLYQLARNEVRQHRRAARRRRQVITPLSHHPSAGERPDAAPSATGALDLGRLRAQLSEDDRSLLVLRYDRGLSYDDIAAVMLGDVEVTRGAARLRQRMREVKAKLAPDWVAAQSPWSSLESWPISRWSRGRELRTSPGPTPCAWKPRSSGPNTSPTWGTSTRSYLGGHALLARRSPWSSR